MTMRPRVSALDREISWANIAEKKVTPGGPGHQWRMMKLKRLYEQAEEQ